MLAPTEGLDPFDGEQVGPHPRDLAPHAVDHLAELLEVGLTGRIVDGGGAFGQGGGHDDVGGSGHGGLVEQHVAAGQSIRGFSAVERLAGVIAEGRAEVLKPDEVRVHAAAANLVPPRLAHVALAEARKQRPHHHDAAAKATALGPELFALEVIEVDVVGLESERPRIALFHLDPHGGEQVDEPVDVHDVRQVGNRDGLGGQQHGAHHLERLVLGPLRGDGSMEGMPSFDDESAHGAVFDLPPNLERETGAPKPAPRGFRQDRRGGANQRLRLPPRCWRKLLEVFRLLFRISLDDTSSFSAGTSRAPPDISRSCARMRASSTAPLFQVRY